MGVLAGMLSVIIPAYNEEQMIKKTADVVGNLLRENEIDYEIIFVNDGSRDHTWEEIEKAHQSDNRVKGICFSRNFGKEGAVFSGLELAKGDCCAVMDCDLQHPPETLISMHRLWKEGYEVIEGVKNSRGKESFLHKQFVKIFYGMMTKSTGIDMSRASDFKLLDRKVVDALLDLPERNVFFRALSSWVGFKTTYVEFDVREREAGESKWSFLSLCRYAVNNVTSFSTSPMQIVTFLGVVMFFFSVLFGLYSVVKYFMGASLEGFTTVIILLLFIGSVLMISMGIIGYYIAKIYEEIKRRPRFIISKITK
jgi:dolichol-phosphate mannosyltransferase